MSRRRWAAIVLLGVLAAIVVTGWVISVVRADRFFHERGTVLEPGTDPRAPEWTTWQSRTLAIENFRGGFHVSVRNRSFRAYPPDWLESFSGHESSSVTAAPRHLRGPSTWSYGVLGLSVTHWESQLESLTEARIPYWLMTFLVGAALAGLLLPRGPRRLRRGLCPACAYDIKHGNACPECGWKAEPEF